MAYDGKLLARARERLEQQREDNLAEHQRRLERVYARVPEIREIDAARRGQMAKLVSLTLSRRPVPSPSVGSGSPRSLSSRLAILPRHPASPSPPAPLAICGLASN